MNVAQRGLIILIRRSWLCRLMDCDLIIITVGLIKGRLIKSIAIALNFVK